MKAIRNGTAKLVIQASNVPAIRKTELEYIVMLNKGLILHWDGNNVELGTACARLHRVGVMVITDSGDSDIVSVVDKERRGQ